MIDKEDVATFSRIAGIALSISSATIMFIRPFDPVANTLAVYFLLIGAAVLVMVGQLLTFALNTAGSFSNTQKRNESLYDVVTIGVVMVLFVIFYVVPFMQKHTNMLG